MVGEASRWFNTQEYRLGVNSLGKVITFKAVIDSAEHIENSIEADIQQKTYGEHTATAVASEAGGWAGAMILGEKGAVLGLSCGTFAPICSPIGAVIGGSVGYFIGSSSAEISIDIIKLAPAPGSYCLAKVGICN